MKRSIRQPACRLSLIFTLVLLMTVFFTPAGALAQTITNGGSFSGSVEGRNWITNVIIGNLDYTVTVNGLDQGSVDSAKILKMYTYRLKLTDWKYQLRFRVPEDQGNTVVSVVGKTRKGKTITFSADGTTTISGEKYLLYSGKARGTDVLKSFSIVLQHKHNYSGPQKTTPATCTASGKVTTSCTTCGNPIVVRTIPATGHNWGDWTVTKEASCEEAGQEQRVCKNDASHVETRPIPAKGHSLTKTEARAATCTEDGNIEFYTCETCGKIFSDQEGKNEITKEATVLPATGHDWGEWTVTKEASCEEAGQEQRVCKNDASHVETRSIPATGHDWGEWIVTKEASCEEAGQEQRVCKNDASHVETRSIPAKGHSLTKTEAKAATCTEDGNIEFYTCETCGKIFSDQEGKNEITKEATVLPATGHDWGKWKVIKKASYHSTGKEQRVCKNDPSHVETRTIPALKKPDNDENPKTGDTSGLTLYLTLLSAALAGLSVTIRGRRNHR